MLCSYNEACFMQTSFWFSCDSLYSYFVFGIKARKRGKSEGAPDIATSQYGCKEQESWRLYCGKSLMPYTHLSYMNLALFYSCHRSLFFLLLYIIVFQRLKQSLLQLNSETIQQLLEKIFKNYRSWCNYLRCESNLK